MNQNEIHIASSKLFSFDIQFFNFSYNLIVTNSMLTTLIVCLFLMMMAAIIGLNLSRNSSEVPNKIQAFFELVLGSLGGFITGTMQVSKLPVLIYSISGFFFAFIAISSWVGLLPGVGQLFVDNGLEKVHLFRAPTTDLNVTVALSIIAFGLIQFQGIAALRWGYLAKFINFASPLAFVVGLLELISEMARLLSFSLRLFGNIFAGEVMLMIVLSMSRIPNPYLDFIGIPFPILIIALELAVALIQAYVFVALFLVFSGLAKEEAH